MVNYNTRILVVVIAAFSATQLIRPENNTSNQQLLRNQNAIPLGENQQYEWHENELATETDYNTSNQQLLRNQNAIPLVENQQHEWHENELATDTATETATSTATETATATAIEAAVTTEIETTNELAIETATELAAAEIETTNATAVETATATETETETVIATPILVETETLTKTATASLFNPNEICSYFPTQPFTATRFWQNHLSQILSASKNPLIPDLLTEEEDSKMHMLLERILSPSRMRRAIRHMPTFRRGHSSVKNVVKILQNRIQDPNSPPLHIAVFGGSVTIGRGCNGKGMQDLKCAWPMRLQLLINQFASQYANLDYDLVKVHNLGVGGTGSGTGTAMIKYWMYPTDLAKVGPDVIINSYSTNDSLPPWNIDPEEDSVTVVMDKVRERLQDFVRVALTSKRCEVPPLVVHVDDYLGPQQTALLGELSYSTAMTQIAKWYDTMAISYGDVVRDLAWHEGDDTFYNKKDVHYGHWAHQTIAWSVGFASLELLSNYCDDEYVKRNEEKVDGLEVNNNATGYDILSSVVAAKVNKSENSDALKTNHLFLPPPLTRESILKNAKIDFTAALELAQKSHANLNCSSIGADNNRDNNITDEVDKNPCIVSWIASPGGYRTQDINNFMKEYSTRSGIPINGWRSENNIADGYSAKVGWIADKINATFTLQFDAVKKDVNHVSVVFMRSYGDKWKDSRAKFTISRVTNTKKEDERGVAILSEEEIAGVHNDTYSLTFTQELSISDTIRKGETFLMKVDLVSGSTFKILGMMLCS